MSIRKKKRCPFIFSDTWAFVPKKKRIKHEKFVDHKSLKGRSKLACRTGKTFLPFKGKRRQAQGKCEASAKHKKNTYFFVLLPLHLTWTLRHLALCQKSKENLARAIMELLSTFSWKLLNDQIDYFPSGLWAVPLSRLITRGVKHIKEKKKSALTVWTLKAISTLKKGIPSKERGNTSSQVIWYICNLIHEWPERLPVLELPQDTSEIGTVNDRVPPKGVCVTTLKLFPWRTSRFILLWLCHTFVYENQNKTKYRISHDSLILITL